MKIFSEQFIQTVDSSFQGSFIEMVAHSGPMAKVVLFILLIFSIISWAIILYKMISFRKARIESEQFKQIFQRGGSLNRTYSSSKQLKNSPLSKVFISGYLDILAIQKSRRKGNPSSDELNIYLEYRDLEGIKRALERAESREISRFEKALGFLATTGSTAPFIGLFGTVWGIMDAFRAIGLKGSASIGGVAPGISEALIATAAGLAAAIPAVIGYNHYNNKIRGVASQIEEFSLELLTKVERNFIRNK